MYCSLTFNLPLRNRRISIFGVDVNHDSESMPSVAAVVASVDDACCQVGEDTGGGPGAHLRMLHVLHAPNGSICMRNICLGTRNPLTILCTEDHSL